MRKKKIERDGFLVSSKLISKDSDRVCPICDIYSWKSDDDVYMNKYECCKKCYYTHVEGFEGAWEEKRKRLLKQKEKIK